MQADQSRIKEAILHCEEELRRAAAAYFARKYSRDDSVMPLVIQAVEKYGREVAFRIMRDAEGLVQTPSTIDWLTGELRRESNLDDVGEDNYRTAIALILEKSPPELLNPDIVDSRNFPEELKAPFLERLEMVAWEWDALWSALEALGREMLDVEEVWMSHIRRASRIVEALARREDHALQVVALVNRQYGGKNRVLMDWLEPSVIDLAGRMRLQEVIPTLVQRMREDNWDVGDSALTALQHIGGDAVVEEIARHWPDFSADSRHGAAEVIGHIPTDLAAEKCLEFLAAEEDGGTRVFLANAALDLFVLESIEPIRQMVSGSWEDLTPDESGLRHRLVAAATIAKVTFPEYDQWFGHAVRNAWGWGEFERDRIRENLREDEELECEQWYEDPV